MGSFGLNLENRLEIIEVNDPPERKPGIMVQDVEELIGKLKSEAKVLS